MEAYGEIVEISPGIAKDRIGEKVIFGTQFGTYAEFITIPETQILNVIPGYTPNENAAFPVNYLTSWVALMEMARLRSSDCILIQAAAGGVGTAAVQIAKAYNCTVFGTASTDDKIELLKKIGVDYPINYLKDDFYEIIKKNTDEDGIDVVLELVGGEVFQKSIHLLNPFGRIIVAGFASLNLNKWNPISWWKTWKAIPRASVANLGESSTGLLATHLGYLLKKPDLLMSTWKQLVEFVDSNTIKPIIGEVFNFEEIPKAHQLIESRESKGKIVINVK